jgi:hypothetical protein
MGVWLRCLVVGAVVLAFPATALAQAPSNADLHFRKAALSSGSGAVSVPLRLSWTAGGSDLGFACCTYHVDEDVHPGLFHAITGQLSMRLRLQIGERSDDPCCYGFSVTGFDSGGNNVGTAQTPFNSQTPEGMQDTDGVVYTGSWVRTTESQFWDGTSETSTARGATATANALFSSGSACGESVAWVSTTGPKHGSAKVYVDGVYAKTVSTYAKKIHYRRVVWSKRVVSDPDGDNACPVIKIVNLATAGHPKVSIDGFIALNDD